MSGPRETLDPVRRRLVLASSSPRRRELLAGLGVGFTWVAPDVDETALPGEDPSVYVERLARTKVAAVTAGADDVVLAADTTVVLDGRILGKPFDAHDARAMLRALAGRPHEVHTGVAVRSGPKLRSSVATTVVTMADIAEDDLAWYLATGEPLDKAGAYGLQGAGGLFVAALVGSASNVVGLPLAVAADLLAEAGHPLSHFR